MKIIDALIANKQSKNPKEAQQLIKDGKAIVAGIRITDIKADIFLRNGELIVVQQVNGVTNVSKRGKST